MYGTELVWAMETLDSNPGSLASGLLDNTLLSCKIINFKPLDSAQEGSNLESIPGCPHSTTLFPLMCVCLYINVQCPAAVQGFREHLASL